MCNTMAVEGWSEKTFMILNNQAGLLLLSQKIKETTEDLDNVTDKTISHIVHRGLEILYETQSPSTKPTLQEMYASAGKDDTESSSQLDQEEGAQISTLDLNRLSAYAKAVGETNPSLDNTSTTKADASSVPSKAIKKKPVNIDTKSKEIKDFFTKYAPDNASPSVFNKGTKEQRRTMLQSFHDRFPEVFEAPSSEDSRDRLVQKFQVGFQKR